MRKARADTQVCPYEFGGVELVVEAGRGRA
jgi:hypothetical protein